MGYLGTPPQSGFITTAKQRVTSSTNNYVDLDHSISSIADVIVFVNFVKQDTTNLSLTTSTRITLGATLVSSDIVEIHYLGKAVNTQTPGTATVTNDMLAGSITASKLSSTAVDNTNTNSTLITAQTEKSSLVDADKFLISDSAASGALKYVQKSNLPSGSHVLISSQTVTSNVGEVLFANVFTSDYEQYLFQGTGMLKNSSSSVRFRVSESTTARTDSSYDWSYGVGMRSRSSTTWSNRGGPTDYAQFMESVHGNTGSFTMFMDIKHEDSSNHGNFYGIETHWTSDGLVQTSFGFTYGGSGSYNGFRIFTSDSNTFGAGTYSLYGVKTT